MNEKRYIKIPKDYFKDVDFKITLPTIKCKICGQDILDTPQNRMKFSAEYEMFDLSDKTTREQIMKLPKSKKLDDIIAEESKSPKFKAKYDFEMKRLQEKSLRDKGICPNCHMTGFVCICNK